VTTISEHVGSCCGFKKVTGKVTKVRLYNTSLMTALHIRNQLGVLPYDNTEGVEDLQPTLALYSKTKDHFPDKLARPLFGKGFIYNAFPATDSLLKSEFDSAPPSRKKLNPNFNYLFKDTVLPQTYVYCCLVFPQDITVVTSAERKLKTLKEEKDLTFYAILKKNQLSSFTKEEKEFIRPFVKYIWKNINTYNILFLLELPRNFKEELDNL
jgi:hypothetical protein